MRLATSAATLACLTLAGCLFIPTPGLNLSGSRDDVEEETVEQIVPGVTTRRDVLLLLGEPDSFTADERTFLYYWVDHYGYAIFSGGNAADPVRVTGDDAFVISFDEHGLVQEHAFGDSETEFLQESMQLRID